MYAHNHNLPQQQKGCWAVVLIIKDDIQSPNVTLSLCIYVWAPLGLVWSIRAMHWGGRWSSQGGGDDPSRV